MNGGELKPYNSKEEALKKEVEDVTWGEILLFGAGALEGVKEALRRVVGKDGMEEGVEGAEEMRGADGAEGLEAVESESPAERSNGFDVDEWLPWST